MYKVLIADDEAIIRQGLVRLLQKDPELHVVGEAEDGELALELAKREKPDLLLVDINMPFLNGLAFIEALQDERDDAVIIVVSGYDDFEYVQRALQLGVFDYLLKPLAEKPFFATLAGAKQRLALKARQRQYYEWAKKRIEQNRPALSAEFLLRWLEGHLSETEAEEELAALGLKLPEGPCGVLLVEPGKDWQAAVQDAWDEQTLYYAADNILREVLEPYAPLLTGKLAGGGVVLVGSAPDAAAFNTAAAEAVELVAAHLPMGEGHSLLVAPCPQEVPALYAQQLEAAGKNAQLSPLGQGAAAYIAAHYTEADFSLQAMAESLHVSPQYLSRAFRREFGGTFMDYVTQMRIRKAVELLAQGDKMVYEIAESLGYSNQHYFSSAFKKVLGVSPVEYRKNSKG